MKAVKILVTGDRDKAKLPPTLGEGKAAIEWLELPVLEFEALPVASETLEALAKNPVDWIIFTSARAVRFWSEAWMDAGEDFPTETKVACVGQVTANAATQDGLDSDFFPSEPGSDRFLAEFEAVLAEAGRKPRVAIPMAEGGRTKIAERLKELGCLVQVIPLYRTRMKADLGNALSPEQIESLNGLLFTSPSSVEAYLSYFTVPKAAQLFAIGTFTESALVEHGLSASLVPGGDLQRIGEVWK